MCVVFVGLFSNSNAENIVQGTVAHRSTYLPIAQIADISGVAITDASVTPSRGLTMERRRGVRSQGKANPFTLFQSEMKAKPFTFLPFLRILDNTTAQ